MKILGLESNQEYTTRQLLQIKHFSETKYLLLRLDNILILMDYCSAVTLKPLQLSILFLNKLQDKIFLDIFQEFVLASLNKRLC